MSRPIRARLDWSALRHNHTVARRHAGAARIWSVVKADAYGHGLLSAARALADATDGFALVELEGAMALRDRFQTSPSAVSRPSRRMGRSTIWRTVAMR